MQSDVTYLGRIIKVDSSSVEVEISEDIPSSSPIINGKVYKLGQIGTFVKVVAGNILTFGLVESVSNTPSNINSDTVVNKGSRYLSVQLIGEKVGNKKFEKGIGLFDLQGAKYIARYIDGSFMAQYPFSILLKSKCTSDKQNLIMTDFMDRLGVFLEEQVIDLSGGRNIIDITQTISTFENSRSEDNIVTLQANFLLKYRKDD